MKKNGDKKSKYKMIKISSIKRKKYQKKLFSKIKNNQKLKICHHYNKNFTKNFNCVICTVKYYFLF